MALKIPAGWDADSLKEAASRCVRMIDSFKSDPMRTKAFDRYNYAQDVFDDVRTPSNLQVVEDVDPKNWPLLTIQTLGAIRLVVSAFNGADPYYVFKGGDDIDLRESREKDTQLALETDAYKAKLRETARVAALKARGPYRIVWHEEKKGEGWADASQIKDGEYSFVGPKQETLEADDFGLYPLSVDKIQDAMAVWHRFDRPMYEIWAKQDRGEYFSREMVEVEAIHEQNTNVEDPEDYAPDLYSGIFKLPPGMKREKDLVAYRITLLYSQQEILFIEPYSLPMPDYFAPGFHYDPVKFYPTHSLASRTIPLNAELNDTQLARLVGAVAGFKATNIVTGHMGEMTTAHVGLGETLMIPNAGAKVYSLATTNPPSGDLMALAREAREYAEGITGFSQIASGQLPQASQTATATGGALAGTAEEGEEKRQNFLEEEVRAVQFRQILIRRNFKAFKKFHGERLQTKKASDWDEQFTIGPNGQGLNNNPEAVQEKMKMFVEALAAIGIPFLEDVEAGKAENVGVAISRVELAKAIDQNFDFPFSTEKILVDTSGIATVPPVDPGAGPFGEIGPAESLIGDPGSLPPELLGIMPPGPEMPVFDPMALAPFDFQPGLDGQVPPFAGVA